MSFGWYDIDGNPVSSDAAMLLKYNSDEDYARIGLDEVDGVRVSTVWLGLDHRHGPFGPPLIFETMVFGGSFDGECQRYPTKDLALAGHNEVVAKLRRGDAPW